MDRSFEVFNIDGTKNREITRFAPLELEINKHTERINVTVTDLNGINIRYPRECKMQHQDILFISRTQRLKPTEDMEKE